MMRQGNQAKRIAMSNPETEKAESFVDVDAEALQRGAQLHAEGRLNEAEQAYRALLQGPPQQVATAHYLLGLLLTDRKDAAGALAQYEAAIGLGAASTDLFFRKGELLRTAGRLPEALASYDQALALQPDAKGCWNSRGIVLEGLGRLDEAVESHDRAIGLDADYVLSHHNRGSVLLRQERLDDAIDAFDQVLARNPAIAETWNFRAVALALLERHDEALTSSEHALALRPDYPEAHNNRSVALRALKRLEEALLAAEAALIARPNFPESLNSKGSALSKLNRFEAACDAYRLALAGKPNDAAIQLNLGMALEALGDLEGAQAAFAAAQALAPALPDARFASGLAHIRAGEVRSGFKLYETRWTQKGGPRHGYARDTLWLGETPLGDRTLLVHAEQGFGDVIQFCRFAPLAAPPSRLVLQVQPPLKRLLTSLDGIGSVFAVGEETPAFDVHIPIMSLPLALDLGLEDLAPRSPYLHASSVLVERWRRTLPPADGPRVGLAWSGNPGHDNDHNRSMTLDALRPLLRQGAQFVSLQKDYRTEDRAGLERAPEILRYDRELGDFADTAALIACCDLVIAVDTAVAHLAGALNKPVWLMLPRFCDWRWMNEREDSPWYPSAKLFRQDAFGDWAGVIERVAARLQTFQR
jgi:tetratricopeptide (TPR) repeat protein